MTYTLVSYDGGFALREDDVAIRPIVTGNETLLMLNTSGNEFVLHPARCLAGEPDSDAVWLDRHAGCVLTQSYASALAILKRMK